MLFCLYVKREHSVKWSGDGYLSIPVSILQLLFSKSSWFLAGRKMLHLVHSPVLSQWERSASRRLPSGKRGMCRSLSAPGSPPSYKLRCMTVGWGAHPAWQHAPHGRVTGPMQPESQPLWAYHASPGRSTSLNTRENLSLVQAMRISCWQQPKLICLISKFSMNVFASCNYIFLLISWTGNTHRHIKTCPESSRCSGSIFSL